MFSIIRARVVLWDSTNSQWCFRGMRINEDAFWIIKSSGTISRMIKEVQAQSAVTSFHFGVLEFGEVAAVLHFLDGLSDHF